MSTVTVYHLSPMRSTFSIDPDFTRAVLTNDKPGYRFTAVARVDVGTLTDSHALEFAFEFTNHIDHDWRDNSSVTVLAGPDARSTSVGDVLEFEGEKYVVAGFGFEKL